MSPLVTGIFAFLIAAAGWFYLFNSRAAASLSQFEDQGINVRRIKFRRLGGLMMILLAMLLYIGAAGVDWETPTIWFLLTWLAILVLLALVMVLALVDLRLTYQLRRRKK